MENNETNSPEVTTDSFEQASSIESIVADFFGENATPEALEPNETRDTEHKQTKPTEADAAENEPTGHVPDNDQPSKTLTSELLLERQELEAKMTAQRQAHKKELTEAIEKARAEAEAAVLAELQNDTLGFLERRQLADKADELALYFYRAALGDDAPAELKERTAKSDVERKFAQMQSEIQKLRQEQADREAQLQASAIMAGYRSYYDSLPSDFTYLKATDPTEAMEAFDNVASQYYAAHGRVPEASEVARIIENALAAEITKYSKHRPAETPAPAIAKKQPTTTLSDDLSDRSDNSNPDSDDLEDRISAVVDLLMENEPPRRSRK